MQIKKLIISADDFGLSYEVNNAILSGIKDGFITSAGIMANMPAFDDAVSRTPENFDIGIHLNISEGKSLTKSNLLCDDNGTFKTCYLKLMASGGNKKLLNEIENEFRAQIEKTIKSTKISHIDSHRHVHLIPAIFDITVKLAQEYGIKYIRTVKEPFYSVFEKNFNVKFPPNIIKHILLNRLTDINRSKYPTVTTNDRFIGVFYTGYQDEQSLLNALKYINKPVTEFIFHPVLPANPANKSQLYGYKEFLITKTPKLKESIKKAGFEITSFKTALNQ